MRNAVGAVQSVLVVGGTSEIALAIVRELVPAGCRDVRLAARPGPRLREAVTAVEALGAAVRTAGWDPVVDAAAADAAIDTLLADERDVDVVLLAAGMLAIDDREALATATAVNFTAQAAAAWSAAQRMREQGHGTIVALSSLAVERPRSDNFAYGATKTALDAFCTGLADALAGSGVAVLVVRPGFVATRMTAHLDPAPFATTPQAVAQAVVAALASGRTQTVWVPGLLRWVGLVFRLLPRRVFRALVRRTTS